MSVHLAFGSSRSDSPKPPAFFRTLTGSVKKKPSDHVTLEALQVHLEALSTDIRSALADGLSELTEDIKNDVHTELDRFASKVSCGNVGGRARSSSSAGRRSSLTSEGSLRCDSPRFRTSVWDKEGPRDDTSSKLNGKGERSEDWHVPKGVKRSAWANTEEVDTLTSEEWASLLDQHTTSSQRLRDFVSTTDDMPFLPWLRFLVQRVVRSHGFDVMACVLVASNALLLGWEADWAARNVGVAATPAFFVSADLVYTFLFTTELFLRICSEGLNFFCHATDCFWNLFDCVVVSFQLADAFLTMPDSEPSDASVKGSSGFNGLSVLRLVRIVRVFRIARVLKMLHLVDDLRSMVRSIVVSFKSLVWALLLIIILIYMLSVCLTQIVTEHRQGIWSTDEEDAGSQEGTGFLTMQANQDRRMQGSLGASLSPDNQKLEVIYGSMISTALVLWECISGGVNWADALDPLVKEVSPWLALVFVAYIAFCVLAMMNVTTGILVDQVVEDAKRNHDKILSQRVRQFFRSFKLNSFGEITWQEFESKLHNETLISLFEMMNTDIGCARGIFTLIDVNDREAINPNEFVNGWFRLRGPAKSLDLALFMHEMDRVNKFICRRLAEINDNVLRQRVDQEPPKALLKKRQSVFNHHKSLIKTSCLFGRMRSGDTSKWEDVMPEDHDDDAL